MMLFIIAFIAVIIAIAVAFVNNKLDLLYQMSHPPDDKCKDHGGNIVAKVLKAHGVDFIFTLCGGHVSPIFVGCEKLGIRVVDTRHEVTAVFAADATARLNRNIGVAVVTAGPGVTNTVTAMKNAQMAESPVLLIGGAAATMAKGRGALQDIDQISVLKSICKYTVSVTRIRDIAPTLRKAIQIAKSGAPGPVFVEMPIDTLYPYELILKEALGGLKPTSFVQKIICWYITKHVGRIFAGAFEPTPSSPLPVDTPLPTDSQIQLAAEYLSRSQKPVFIIGSQIIAPPASLEKVAGHLERLGVPTYLGGMARGLLGANSKVQCRHNRRNALKNADFVLIAGTVCDFRLGYGRQLPKNAKIVAVNRSKEQLLKNARVFWNPSLAVQGDVGTFIERLAASLKSYTADETWLKECKESDAKRDDVIRGQAVEKLEKGLNPLSVLSMFDKVLDKNSILVADGGDFVGSAAYIVKPTAPLGWLDPGAFGTLGVGAGFALGAKLCRPDANVWVIFGDGSLGYSLAEFDTFVRHKIPVIGLVGNDACWSQIYREQVVILKSDVACMLAHTDYHNAVEALGGNGVLLDDSQSTEEVRQVLEDARKSAMTVSKPALVNCIIGKTHFRDGSISV